jgi:NAD(P)H-flavin reductase
MVKIRFDGRSYDCGETQSVLEALTTHGAPIPSSCRNGICQTCLMQALCGELPADAQRGLKETQQQQNYFLACSCYPQSDLEVVLPDQMGTRAKAMVHSIEKLNAEIALVRLISESPLNYKPGQYINLFREDSLARCYSLASVPDDDYHLHLHVRRLPQGRMSSWIHDELKVGDALDISGAMGDCFYVPGNEDQPLLLIGTGSGLAPLYGIVRDALRARHVGQVALYHGSRSAADLYLMEELRELALRHPNFRYTPCVSGEEVPSGHAAGRALSVALSDTPSLKGWRVYVCGHPDMVATTKKKTFLAGASMKDIYSDSFVLAKS